MLSSLYLRLSVTDRCNLRCAYCRSAEDSAEPECGRLSAPALVRLISLCNEVLPVQKVRLTGGEPLVRRDVPELVSSLRAALPSATLALTTNGALLARYASTLRCSGLNALNVSIDSLEASSFAKLTGGGSLRSTLEGLQAAKEVGFETLKTNTVLMRSFNGAQLVSLVRLAADLGAEPRFIELMPLGQGASLFASEYLSCTEARDILSQHLRLEDELEGSATARRYRFSDGPRSITVGFITPVSMPFCRSCNRLRLDSRGMLWGCLRQKLGVDLAPMLQAQDDEQIRQAVASLVARRTPPGQGWAGHKMVAIGG